MLINSSLSNCYNTQPPDRKTSGGFFCAKNNFKNFLLSGTFCVEQLKSTAINVERFVSLARKYTDIRELTPEILRTFIGKIVIHERPSRKKNEGEQRIDIYFTHIGSMPDGESERVDHCRDKAISAITAGFSDAHQKPFSTIRA